MKVEITYCSNYNGCSIYFYDANDEEIKMTDEMQAKVNACTDKIVNKAYEECNPHGEFYGDIDDLEEFAKKVVNEAFGSDVEEVTFEEDNMST